MIQQAPTIYYEDGDRLDPGWYYTAKGREHGPFESMSDALVALERECGIDVRTLTVTAFAEARRSPGFTAKERDVEMLRRFVGEHFKEAELIRGWTHNSAGNACFGWYLRHPAGREEPLGYSAAVALYRACKIKAAD